MNKDKRIQLDRSKLLGFRKVQPVQNREGLNKESFKRVLRATVGSKVVGLKSGVKVAGK
jgi:hypothetical protein